MKYIVLDLNDKEYMVIFPNSPKMSHKNMAESVQSIRVESRNSWKREFRTSNIVSAGFVDVSGNCSGYSETLKLKSREDQDSILFKETYYE